MIAICYVYLSSFRAVSAGHNRKECVFWHKGWLRRFTQFRQNATRINNGTNWYSKPFNSVLYNRLIWNLSKDLRILWNIIEKLHKKWSFPLRISSVNVTKSAGNFFKEWFSRTCLITTIKMDYLLSASLVFFLVALAFHSYYLLFMVSTLHLTVMGVFLDIFKAFDKVWHHGL